MKSRETDAPPDDPMLDAIALAIQPIELSIHQRERMRQRTLQMARDAAPDGTRTQREADVQWTEIAPLVQVRELWRDESATIHVSMLRMQPGGVIPAHRHAKDEDFIVLDGECHIGAHLLRTGDAHKATAGSVHGDVTTRTGVTVLIRGELPYPSPHR